MNPSLKSLFFQYMAQTTLEPIALRVERAEGVHLYDDQGNSYIDLISGISVSNLGHQNPAIVKAVKDQMDQHMHIMVYGEVVHSTPVMLSELLCKHMPDSLQNVYLVNSGNEATDVAMKLAKRITGRADFVAHYEAYHGSGQGPLSLMSDPYFTQRFRPLLNQVYYIRQNDLTAVNSLPPKGVAAVIIELVQAERGALPSDLEYVRALREYCTKTGSLLIFDEIQTGLFRTGTFMAFEKYNVVPDILLLGKAFGGGMPMAAVLSSKDFMSRFTQNPILGHITTFGGHPVCAAAALANLQQLIVRRDEWNVAQKEEAFRNLLVHPLIERVTGRGLLLACHIHPNIDIIALNKVLLSQGVFTDWFLFNAHAIRIAPPLIINLTDIHRVCEVILSSLNFFQNKIGG
jgi:acetylornithine/N-succinyldiaminopimelate aminotransferase